ncbi:MipA/OmpV family protein [Sphingopyxis indica]|uniref:MipA/OmpV family protein n=1 Tax=Sphingopyxis indica TaxID=436663 RepID=UPI00293911EF|nr:MipA/OmpV family protein [Sphingopyxis indica]WOF43216.1 MipA/OmpV family protein [Sphingopyxis indica]
MHRPVVRLAPSRPAASLFLALGAALLAFPAQADEMALAPDPGALDNISLADEIIAKRPIAPAPAAYMQDRDIDQDILFPPTNPDDDDPDRKWARDYFAIAGGVLTSPRYNGADDNVVLPGGYLRGRISGFSFSTRGTNFQVDLIRQRRGQRIDWKLGPVVNLRSDRTGRIGDPQVEALGEKKVAVELGLTGGVTMTGVFTSKYDQLGLRFIVLADISGRHSSWVASPTIEYSTPLSKRAYIGMSVSVNVYGKGFGAYYFDVDPLGSAASGLPVYERAGRKATAGKYTIGVAGAYSLSGDLRKGFALLTGVQYGRMASRFAASPIVAIAGDKDQWIAGAGVAYQF